MKPTPRISPQMPADVCIPDGFPGIALDYFDDYSWRALVALVWPAAPGQRGVAASAKPIGTSGPRVFETYKPLWEIFHADGSAPAAGVQPLRCGGRQPVRGDGAVRRRDHRIGVGDRRHRAGGHRRPRSAARRAERALRPDADALQSDRLRSHRAEPLLPARRAAARAEPAARPPRHRLPRRFDRRQIRVDRRHRSAAGAGETVLHAHGARETRDGLRMRAHDDRTHRAAHRAEDAEPPAVDLVVVRAGRHRAAEMGRLAGRLRAERRHRRADAGAESVVARAAGARAGAAVQRRARGRRADSHGHRADQLRLPPSARRHAVAVPTG